MKPVYDRMTEILLEAGKKREDENIPELLAKLRVKRTGPSKKALKAAAEKSGSARMARLNKLMAQRKAEADK